LRLKALDFELNRFHIVQTTTWTGGATVVLPQKEKAGSDAPGLVEKE
jgi:hypothetical protein